MSPPGATLSARRVSRWFGDVMAVSDVSLEAGPGVTALVGPNGAGKTTLIRLLCGLARPSRGQVRLDGRDPRRDLAALARIGYVPEPAGLIEALSAPELVRAAGVLHGLADADHAAAAALHAVDLDPGDRRAVRAYSKGMRQRVKVAQALVAQPPVLVLDEPLAGLDPAQRRTLAGMVRRLGEEGRTVVVSSHVLAEVEPLADRVVVLLGGRVAAEGGVGAIRELMDDRPHRLRIATDAPAPLAAALLRDGLATGVRLLAGGAVEVETSAVAALRARVAAVAAHEGACLRELVPLDDDLDSVFRYLVDPAQGGGRSPR